MNRRKFLQWLGIAPIAATITTHCPFPKLETSVPTLGQYSDYANFSEFAVGNYYISPETEKLATILGQRAAITYNSDVG